jgi:hypothetical protein
MIPLVAGLSVYGSRRAAPHEPSAPTQREQPFNGDLPKSSIEACRTISHKLDAPDIQTPVTTIVD